MVTLFQIHTSQAEVSIVENETLPVITVAAEANTVNEGENANFVLSTSHLSAVNFDINVEVTGKFKWNFGSKCSNSSSGYTGRINTINHSGNRNRR